MIKLNAFFHATNERLFLYIAVYYYFHSNNWIRISYVEKLKKDHHHLLSAYCVSGSIFDSCDTKSKLQCTK